MAAQALVTGGGGFLGSALCRRLRELGWGVRAFQRSDAPGLAAIGVEVARGDIADPGAVAAAVEGCDLVFHTAAQAGIWGRHRDFYRVNVTGTVNVIAACARHGVGRLVHTSSPSVVAPSEGDLIGADESTPYPERYLASYPETKAMAERMVLAADDASLRTVALRPHLIWGPGDNHLVPRIVARARRGRLRLVGDGENLVDSVVVDNAVDAHLQAAEALAKPRPRAAGRAYFITNGEPLAMRELLGRILAAAGLGPVTRRVPYPRAHVIGYHLERIYRLLRLRREPPMTRFLAHQLASTHTFDIGAARRDLDYAPRVSIGDGFERLARWLGGSGPGERP